MCAAPHERKAIERICRENGEFYRDPKGHGALRDLQQTFPHPWLYVAELLQNAVDVHATQIKVVPADDGSVVFEHNGSAFSEPNVESLCARGVSSKGAGTVGFMGIGFKSVFHSFERVEVASAKWRFSLTVSTKKGERYGDRQRDWLGAVLPEWSSDIEAPTAGMTCRFRLCRRLPGLPPALCDLDRLLGTDDVLLALLAWQNVESLTWGGRTWALEREEVPFTDGSGSRVELASRDLDGEVTRRWTLFSKTYQPSDGAIARFLEHRQLAPSDEGKPRVYEEAGRDRQVAVFCEIDSEGDPRPVDRGSAFALLPTGVTFPMGLHVQADWLLVVSRQELMQIEGNEWHEEILHQLPDLLARFLSWLVEAPWPENSNWNRGYDALPGGFSDNGELDAWFKSDNFRTAVAACLKRHPFLPVPAGNNRPISFIRPEQAYALPRPMTKLFDRDGTSHRILFGDDAFSSAILGDRAAKYLRDLRILAELSPGHLEEKWAEGAIGRWMDQLDEDRQDRALAELLEALAALDSDEKWGKAKLPCLPTEAGGWMCRDEAQRFPPDWDIVAHEEEIRSLLEPFIGEASQVIRWSFDRFLRLSSGSGYLKNIASPKLDELAKKWWACLPNEPAARDIDIAIHFTAWVRSKQKQRTALVRKVLAKDSKNNLLLLPAPEVLVAEPYAERSRRTWFADVPVVASEYLGADPEASRSDWQSFFESLAPPPLGRLSLSFSARRYSPEQLRELMGNSYDPPALRVTQRRVEWREFGLRSSEYKILDADLPAPMLRLIVDPQPVTRDESRAIEAWVAESAGMLRQNARQKLAFIPFSWGCADEQELHWDATWIARLQDAAWVYGKGGSGPAYPGDVLAAADPARPEAPIADLCEDVVRLLADVGVTFGSRLADAPAIAHLCAQQTVNAEQSLRAILAWWDEQRAWRVAEYERQVFPNGRLLSLANGEDAQARRKDWAILLLLGLTHTMGRTVAGQHREFLRQCDRDGRLDMIATSERDPGRWMTWIDDFLDRQIDESEFLHWMKQFVGIYQVSRHLDDYIEAFLAVERFKSPFSLTQVSNTKASSVHQGGGISAPPLSRVLGMGQCFILRELMRHGVLKNPLAHRHCYVPVGRVRRMLQRMGCDGLLNRQRAWEWSSTIHGFLCDKLDCADAATFHGDFDIPLQIIAEDKDLQAEFVSGAISPEEDDEDNGLWTEDGEEPNGGGE